MSQTTDRYDVASQWKFKAENGTLTEAERMERDAWLAEHPDNRKAFQSVTEICDDLYEMRSMRSRRPAGSSMPEFGAQVAWRSANARRGAALKWSPSGSFVVTALAGVLFALYLPSHRFDIGSHVEINAAGEAAGEVVRTQPGVGTTEMQLADGSRLRIDEDSEIVILLKRDTRAIDLTRGGAEFDVAADPNRPFVVKSRDASLRALGTEFSVRVRAGWTALEVIRGEVLVDMHSSAPVEYRTLVPGEEARMTGGNIYVSPIGEGRRAPSHVPGHRFILAQAKVRDVVREFNRHSGEKIEVENPALEQREVSGVLKATDAALLARSLASMLEAEALIPKGSHGTIRLVTALTATSAFTQ